MNNLYPEYDIKLLTHSHRDKDMDELIMMGALVIANGALIAANHFLLTMKIPTPER